MIKNTYYRYGIAVIALILAIVLYSAQSSHHLPAIGTAQLSGSRPLIDVQSHGIDDESVLITDVSAWRTKLLDGGVLRIKTEGVDESGAKEVSGLGRLEGEDREFARNGIVNALENAERAMAKSFDTEGGTAGILNEAALLAEAVASVNALQYSAFLSGFDKGEYYVVRSYEDKLPTPKGFRALNVGSTYRGQAALCVVLIRDKDYGLDVAQELVSERRRAWLAMVAQQFNSLSDQDRIQALERRFRNSPDDKQWIRKNFPDGLGVDRQRNVVYVE
jgi:hypothetical protein